MSAPDERELPALISKGESDNLEFKKDMSGNAKSKIAETICAFANNLPGHGKPGIILIGVEDDGSILGVPPDQIEQVQQVAGNMRAGNIVPPPSLTVTRAQLAGRTIVVIEVQPSRATPVKCAGRIWVRTGTINGTASAEDERILNERRQSYSQGAFFDTESITTADITDLNTLQFRQEYLPQVFSREVLQANDRNEQQQLAATKMTDARGTPTVLGILAIGTRPQDFLPGAYVQFVRIAGDALTDSIIDEQRIRGSIGDIIRVLDDKIAAHNQIAINITSGKTEQRTSQYPLSALEQLTRNTVMHRLYEQTNEPVRVYWYNSRIEITNPGGAFGTVRGHFGQAGFMDYRNPSLAEAMKNMGYVQQFGFGIKHAITALREAGHPAAEFEDKDSRVQVTIHARQPQP